MTLVFVDCNRVRSRRGPRVGVVSIIPLFLFIINNVVLGAVTVTTAGAVVTTEGSLSSPTTLPTPMVAMGPWNGKKQVSVRLGVQCTVQWGGKRT